MPGSQIVFWKKVSLYRLDYFMSACKDEIVALLNGQTKELHLDLKIFSEHKIYSIRLNRSDRLLFTVVNAGILFLEILWDHDYVKSIYLKPHNLTHLLQNKNEEIHQFIDKKTLYATYQIGCAERVGCAQEAGLSPLYFSASQVAAEYNYPICIAGPSGAGKTTWLVQHFEKEILSSGCQESKKMLFLSASAAQVRTQCVAKFGEEAVEHLHFLTYTQLLEAHFQIAPTQLVLQTHFNQWYESYSQLPKNKKFLKTVNTEKVFQEFCVIASNTGGYLTLGARASFFHEEGERLLMLQAYKEYSQVLQAKNQVFPPLFYAEIKEPIFDFVFVDNGQELSPNALKLLLMLSKKTHFAIAYDTNHAIFPKMHTSLHQLLKDKISLLKLKDEITTITLTKTFRCSLNVVRFVTHLLDLKDQLIGKDKKTIIESDITQGEVLWETSYPENTQDFARYIKLLRKKVQVLENDIVLVVPSLLIESVQKSDLLRLTPHVRLCDPLEVMAYEGAVVIYWRPFDNNPMYSQLNRALSQYEEDTHGGEKVLLSQEFASVLGEFYGVSLRAKQFLIVMQKESHACQHLMKYFKRDLPCLNEVRALEPSLKSLVPAKTSLECKNRFFPEQDLTRLPCFLRTAHTA